MGHAVRTWSRGAARGVAGMAGRLPERHLRPAANGAIVRRWLPHPKSGPMPTPLPRPRASTVFRSVPSVLALVAVVAGTTGCYSYKPVTQARLAPEMEVRLQLTAVAVDRLRRGSNNEGRLLDDFSVSGTLASVSADSVVVSVPTTTVPDPGARAVTFRQPLSIAWSDVQQAEVRTLDRKRTTITSIVLGALGIAAAIYAIERGGESSGTTPVPGGPNEVRIPPLGSGK